MVVEGTRVTFGPAAREELAESPPTRRRFHTADLDSATASFTSSETGSETPLLPLTRCARRCTQRTC
ncbi:hypothetical protein GCM10020219_084960 [Nonomuraea dietziae]